MSTAVIIRWRSASLPTRQPAFLHLMIEVNDIDDVGAALDMCEQRNIPITTTLGRHSNDT